MSLNRWLLSAGLLFHIVALTAAAIPTPDRMGRHTSEQEQIRHPFDDPVAAVLTPSMDRAGLWLERIHPVVFKTVSPIRWATWPYVEIGLHQVWDMFSNPATDDHYVRLTYYTAPVGFPHARWAVQELVYPAQRDDRVRLTHDFQDKVVSSAIEKARVRLGQERKASLSKAPPIGKMPDDPRAAELVPLARFFAKRYRERYLTPGERVLRTEIWYGSAAMPPRGRQLDDQVLRARHDVLAKYYDGPVPSVSVGSTYQSLWTTQREADIKWQLVLIDQS
jgi:hypothetical protein